MVEIKLNHTRWRYRNSIVINESKIILENEDTHVESLEIYIYKDDKKIKTISISSSGDVEVKE